MLLLLAVGAFILAPALPLGKLATHTHWGDAPFNVHLTAWGHHTLVTRPWRYFDLPLFHPQAMSGAFNATSPLLFLLTAPFAIAGNPVLAYNLTVLAAVALTAISGYVAGYVLTKSRRAALVAGAIIGFNGDVQWHLPGHINIIAAFGLPLTVAACIAWRRQPDSRRALAIAGGLAVAFACDWYIGFIALAGALLMIATSSAISPRPSVAALARLAGALAVVLLVAAIASTPYRSVTARLGESRGLHEATLLSAEPLEYLLPSRDPERPRPVLGHLVGAVLPRLGVTWRTRLENSQFFGYLAWWLAGAAVWGAWRRRSRQTNTLEDKLLLPLLFLGLGAFVLSLGPFLWFGPYLTGIPMPWRFVFEWVPPLRFMRACGRFAALVGVAVALLAANALAQSLWFNRPGLLSRYAALSVVLAVLVCEFRPWDVAAMRPWQRESAEVIARHPEFRVVAPLPLYSQDFLIDATAHFPLTPGGYRGGVRNHHYERLTEVIERFPEETALDALAALGVEAVAIYREPWISASRGLEALEPVEAWPGGGLFALRPRDPMAVERARQQLRAIPERPPVSLAATGVASPRGIVLVGEGGKHRAQEWRVRYLNHVWTTLTPPIPVREVPRVRALIAAEDPGVSVAEARLMYVTTSNPATNATRACTARYVPDGKPHWVEFRLEETPGFAEGGTLQGLALEPTLGAWPGQRLRLLELRLELPGDGAP